MIFLTSVIGWANNKIFSPQNVTSKNNVFNEDKISYKNFIDSLIDNQNSENFFNYRNHEIQHCKQKLGILSEKLTDSVKILKEEMNNKKKFANELREDIENRKINREKNNNCININQEDEVNSSIPSLNFVNKIYANTKEYSDRFHEIKNIYFSPNPMYHNNLKLNTRFSGNTDKKDTYMMVKPRNDCSYYIDEQNRFFKNVNGTIDFQTIDKENKAKVDISKLKRIFKNNEIVVKKAYDNQVLNDQKDDMRQFGGTQKFYNYKNVIFILIFIYRLY